MIARENRAPVFEYANQAIFCDIRLYLIFWQIGQSIPFQRSRQNRLRKYAGEPTTVIRKSGAIRTVIMSLAT